MAGMVRSAQNVCDGVANPVALSYIQVRANRKSRHFGRDAEIQAMDGSQSVVKMPDSGDLPAFNIMDMDTSPAKPKMPSFRPGCRNPEPWMVIFRLRKCLIQVTWQPVVSHPWTLDFCIPAEMTGLPLLCITTRVPAWEPLSQL